MEIADDIGVSDDVLKLPYKHLGIKPESFKHSDDFTQRVFSVAINGQIAVDMDTMILIIRDETLRLNSTQKLSEYLHSQHTGNDV